MGHNSIYAGVNLNKVIKSGTSSNKYSMDIPDISNAKHAHLHAMKLCIK